MPRRITHLLVILILAVVSSGCGTMIGGKIYSLSDAKVLPMKIALSYGSGRMTAEDPKTGEKFSGEYTAVSDGAHGMVGNNVVALNSRKANAMAVLIGDKGTVLNCVMEIQKGIPPKGIGTAKDNHGNEYQIQF